MQIHGKMLFVMRTTKSEKTPHASAFLSTQSHPTVAHMLPRPHLLLPLLACAAAMTAVTTQIYPNDPSEDVSLQPIGSGPIYAAAGLPDQGANVLRSETHENLFVAPPSTTPHTHPSFAPSTANPPRQTPAPSASTTPPPPPQPSDASTTGTTVVIAAVLAVAVVGGIAAWCMLAAPAAHAGLAMPADCRLAATCSLVRMTAGDRPEIAVKIL